VGRQFNEKVLLLQPPSVVIQLCVWVIISNQVDDRKLRIFYKLDDGFKKFIVFDSSDVCGVSFCVSMVFEEYGTLFVFSFDT
jgi:hypothetical protein